MRFRPASLIGTLLLLSLIHFPACLLASSGPRVSASTSESSSVSGKVANVSETQLTLSIGREHKLNTLDFVLTSDTKIEGELVVGAQATVDYRIEGEHLVATRVMVTAASGVRPY